MRKKGERKMKREEWKRGCKRAGCLLAVLGTGAVLCGCSPEKTGSDPAGVSPTGYPSGEVQRQTVYYGGRLYWYQGEGFELPLETGFEKAGTVEKVLTEEYPSEELWGTRLKEGQEVYADPAEPEVLYVKYENGYGRFETEEGEAAGKTDSQAVRQLRKARLPEEPAYQSDEERWEAERNKRLPEDFTAAYGEFSYETAAGLLRDTKENAVYSPLGLYYALAAAAQGAEGKTREELLSLLGYDSAEALERDCKSSFEALYHVPGEGNRTKAGKEPHTSELYSLQIAGSLWADDGFSLKEAFADKASEAFYMDVFQGDLQGEAAGEAMAGWVQEHTGGMICPKPSPLPENTELSLRNTVYFYDQWQDRFPLEATAEDVFYGGDGRETVCDFMNRRDASAGFRRGENFTASELFLKNGAMVFVLPDEGTDVRELVRSAETLEEALCGSSGQGWGEVVWKVPVFSYGYKAEGMKEMLQTLGVREAFGETADFSGLSDQKPLGISDIIQEVHIGIDENGVEAAAFTEIFWAGAALPQGRAEMVLNRPFLYAVKNKGQLLFVGICQNPAS